jgi:hypothetical protein
VRTRLDSEGVLGSGGVRSARRAVSVGHAQRSDYGPTVTVSRIELNLGSVESGARPPELSRATHRLSETDISSSAPDNRHPPNISRLNASREAPGTDSGSRDSKCRRIYLKTDCAIRHHRQTFIRIAPKGSVRQHSVTQRWVGVRQERPSDWY